MAFSVKDALADPQFQSLPDSDKTQILAQLDPQFASLPDSDKAGVISSFKSAPPPPPQDPMQPPSERIGDEAGWARKMTPTPETLSAMYTPALKYGLPAVADSLALPALVAMGPAGLPAGVAMTAGAVATGSSIADKLDQMIGLASPPKSYSEIGKKELENLREGSMFALTGPIANEYLAAGAKGAANLASTAVVRGPAAIARISEAAAKLGINLTPAELTASRGLSLMESILSHLPWTSDILAAHHLGELDKLTQKVNTLIAENGSSREIEDLTIRMKNQVDDIMQKTARVNKEASMAMKDRLLTKMGSLAKYEDLDASAQEIAQKGVLQLNKQLDDVHTGIAKAVGDKTIVPNNLKAEAEKILAEQQGIVGTNSALKSAAKFYAETPASGGIPPQVLAQFADFSGKIPPTVKNALMEQYPGISNIEEEKTYQQLKDQIRLFNDKKYANIDTAGGAYRQTPEAHQWDRLIKAAKQDMASLANSTGDPEIIKAREIADQLQQRKLSYFEDPAFKKINSQSPGSVTKAILQSNNPQLIDRYKAIVGDDLFNKAKSRLTTDILGLGGGDISTGKEVRDAVTNLGESGLHIYNQQELVYFKKLADAIDTKAGATTELLQNPLVKKIFGGGKMIDGEFLPKNQLVPTGIAKALVIPQNSGAAGALEQTFGKSAKESVANTFLPNLLAEDQNGFFKPLTFARTYNKYGYETLKSWYGEKTANQLKDIATVGLNMGNAQKLGGNPSGTASHLIAFYEGRRILNDAADAVFEESPKAAFNLGKEGTFIIAGRALAKAYVQPEAKNLFLKGLTLPAGSDQAKAIMAKLLPILMTEHIGKKK